jgi:hypothetical protein
VNAMTKNSKDFPEGYIALNDAPQYFGIPGSTFRRYTDHGEIAVSLINDELAINIDETIAVLMEPTKTRRKTRLRLIEGLKKIGVEVKGKRDLFA